MADREERKIQDFTDPETGVIDLAKARAVLRPESLDPEREAHEQIQALPLAVGLEDLACPQLRLVENTGIVDGSGNLPIENSMRINESSSYWIQPVQPAAGAQNDEAYSRYLSELRKWEAIFRSKSGKYGSSMSDEGWERLARYSLILEVGSATEKVRQERLSELYAIILNGG